MTHENHHETSAISNQLICFYGAGSMAEAIARGLLNQELIPGKQVSMLNRSNKERQQQLHLHYGVQTAMQGKTNAQYLQEANIIFLAMKPKDAVEAIRSLKPNLSSNQLIISVIAGLSISAIEKLIGNEMAIVRTMPNTSSTIGLGATGISYSSSVSEEQRFMTEMMFESVGIHVVIEEQLQDAVTSVSGSGPAYFYYVMESMIKGAQQAGLTAEQAKLLVVQTALGAASMVNTTGEDPADLRRKVTSPNGTTQAALETMAEGNLEATIIAGMNRCAQRAQEIGKGIEEDI
ncbi:pyrroline-5-carboxylate reductase [Paenibacillus endoradicis]|uniref:pyrroline-5-carboxylate reductase n=1 Tax=Paenibacillus endoradicis TaxID=2972487 RepID=UPI00215906B7|nr:pyrroline-5-carboxylate reductase [Paenibacillus endoradicis]MCR8660618.1 pyrroline-5-carboxylate reductase [Paenibacillus endoradicis]